MNILLLLCICLATIYKQSLEKSHLKFDFPTIIKVPNHIYVKNYIENIHPYYLIKDAIIYKPIRKFFEYEYNAETGVEYKIIRSKKDLYDDLNGMEDNLLLIKDSIAVGEFNAIYFGIASFGVIVAIILRYFCPLK